MPAPTAWGLVLSLSNLVFAEKVARMGLNNRMAGGLNRSDVQAAYTRLSDSEALHARNGRNGRQP